MIKRLFSRIRRNDKLAARLKTAEMFISSKKLLYDYVEYSVSSDNYYPLDKFDDKYMLEHAKAFITETPDELIANIKRRWRRCGGLRGLWLVAVDKYSYRFRRFVNRYASRFIKLKDTPR